MLQVLEVRTHIKCKQPMYPTQLKEADEGVCDDDEVKSTPQENPRGGIPSTPVLLKGVTLPHTHELIHFSQRGTGVVRGQFGHPSFKPAASYAKEQPPWHAAVSRAFRERPGAQISENVPAELLIQETIQQMHGSGRHLNSDAYYVREWVLTSLDSRAMLPALQWSLMKRRYLPPNIELC